MTQLATTMDKEESQQHLSQTSEKSSAGEDSQSLNPHIYEDAKADVPAEHLGSSQTTESLPPSGSEDGGTPRGRVFAGNSQRVIDLTLDSDPIQAPALKRRHTSPGKRTYSEFTERSHSLGDEKLDDEHATEDDASHLVDSQESSISANRLEARRNAFNAMNGVAPAPSAWDGLLSTTNNHTHLEPELGEG